MQRLVDIKGLIATDAETVAGIVTNEAVSPAGLSARLASPGAIGGISAAELVSTEDLDITQHGSIGKAYLAPNHWLPRQAVVLPSHQILQGATRRYNVASTNVSNLAAVFDGGYEEPSTTPAATTATIEIDFNNLYPWTTNAAGGITYLFGTLVLSFYDNQSANDITVEVYRYNPGSTLDEWVTVGALSGNSASVIFFDLERTYAKKLKVSYSAPDRAVWLTELEFALKRSDNRQTDSTFLPTSSSTTLKLWTPKLQVEGAVEITSTTASTSTTTGAAVIGGGAGVVGNLHVGGKDNSLGGIPVISRTQIINNLSTTPVSINGGSTPLGKLTLSLKTVDTHYCTLEILTGLQQGVSFKFKVISASHGTITEVNPLTYQISGLGDGRVYQLTMDGSNGGLVIQADAATTGDTAVNFIAFRFN